MFATMIGISRKRQMLFYVFVVLSILDFQQQCEGFSSSSSSFQQKDRLSSLLATTAPTGTTTTTSFSDEEHEEYSRSLSPRQDRKQIYKEYVALYDEGPLWRQRLLRPIKAVHRRVRPNKHPGNLILIKSGESEGKRDEVFTGWANPKLTLQGEQECRHAARLLLEAGYEPDVIYTSMLNRAIRSVWIINNEMDSIFLPCYKSWRLNERMYGSIQGLNKRDTALKFGEDVVQAWRYVERIMYIDVVCLHWNSDPFDLIFFH